MATKTWNGSTGAFTTDSNWSPEGAPAAGDQAIINGGTVSATGTLPGALTVALTASRFSSPTLALTDATLPSTSALNITAGGSNATLQLRGQVLNEGTWRASGAAPGATFLQINDASGGGATVVRNTGSILVSGSALQVVNFGANAGTQFRNDGVVSLLSPTLAAQQAYFGVNLTGTGTFVLGGGVNFEAVGLVGSGLTFSFERGVGTATILNMRAGPGFQGTVDGFAALDTINLFSPEWNTYAYTSTGVGAGVLTLSLNGVVSKSIPFRGNYTRDSFVLQQSAPNAAGGSATVVRTNVAEGGASDRVDGTPGNDVFTDDGRNLTYVGGGGYDTLVVNEGRRGVTFTLQSNGDVIFTHRGQTDTLRSIEEIRFIDGREAFSPSDAAAQVQRLYQAGLGRVGEQEGLNFWINAIGQVGLPLSALAQGFLSSTEFTTRFGNIATSTDYVTRIYQNVLGRNPEQSGLDFWVDALESGRGNRAEVLAGISESTENRNITATLVATGIWDITETAGQVARMYDTALGRVPDAGGLQFWTNGINSGVADILALAQSFVTSTEFQSTYGALANRAFVERVYVNTLDRPGETEGVDFWTGRLDAGVSRAQVVTGFSESTEHQNLTKPDILPESVVNMGIRLA